MGGDLLHGGQAEHPDARGTAEHPGNLEEAPGEGALDPASRKEPAFHGQAGPFQEGEGSLCPRPGEGEEEEGEEDRQAGDLDLHRAPPAGMFPK